jgi:hypothetical protein
MTVARFLAFLIAFALSVSNSAALAGAICTHHDAHGHAAALASADSQVAAGARAEESAAKSSQAAALADGAAAAFAAYALPPMPAALPLPIFKPMRPATARDSPGLASRSLRPLLEPPLA